MTEVGKCPSCTHDLVNGVCTFCTFATESAKQRAKNAPPIVVKQPKKQEPRGSVRQSKQANKQEPKQDNKKGGSSSSKRKK